jgi:hypothetical protein
VTKTQIALVGLGAGAASALMFASIASGSLLSIALFYVTPLPIMIAALGWSHWAAAIAALGAATTLAATFGSVFFFAFMVGTGIPAWWLGYLAMLARPAANGGNLEWYPPGRLVLWCAGLAASVICIGILTFGTDIDTFHHEMRQALERIIEFRQDSTGGNMPDRAQLFDFLVAVIPSAAAVVATATNTINLWLAARIVKFSGRLQRPWPDLPALAFPGMAAAVFAVAVGLTFVGGIAGLLATVASAALVVAYGVLGFAVLHAMTRNARTRGLVLGTAYASVILFFWPIFALCLLGLADAAIDLRGRAARRGGPPAAT